MTDYVPLSELLKHTAALSERDRREAEQIMSALIRDYLSQQAGVYLNQEKGTKQ